MVKGVDLKREDIGGAALAGDAGEALSHPLLVAVGRVRAQGHQAQARQWLRARCYGSNRV